MQIFPIIHQELETFVSFLIDVMNKMKKNWLNSFLIHILCLTGGSISESWILDSHTYSKHVCRQFSPNKLKEKLISFESSYIREFEGEQNI